MVRYFDGHCDSIYIAYDKNLDLYHNELFVNIESRKKFNKYCQIFAIWMDDVITGDNAFAYVQDVYKYTLSQEEKYKDHFKICRTIDDYNMAITQDKLCGFLMVEGANALGGYIENVQKLRNQGFIIMTMTWNNENEVGYGCKANPNKGLKSFGKEVLMQMQECGMVCDVSHLNDAGFDACAASDCMMLATHSNSREVLNDPRNISDDQFRVLMQKGTGAGVNLFPPFVGPEKSAKEVVEHIDHFLSLGGEDHVFIGADFDGIPPVLPRLEGFSTLNDMYKLVDEMVKLNYSGELIDKIFFGNIDRIIRDILNNENGPSTSIPEATS
jgi:membrane dipeptidase